MAKLCKTFCDLEKSNFISFWLSTHRGCKCYHIDNVLQRLLVTYAGQGTEWFPNEATDIRTYLNGEPNQNIVKNVNKKNYIENGILQSLREVKEGYYFTHLTRL